MISIFKETSLPITAWWIWLPITVILAGVTAFLLFTYDLGFYILIAVSVNVPFFAIMLTVCITEKSGGQRINKLGETLERWNK